MFKGVSTACFSGAVIFLVARAQAQLPAFPGADGAGAFAPGGRGGIVYHVTKLDRNFSHTEIGTLRYGFNDANFPAGTKRTIVFDVAGTFWLGRYGAERPEYDNGWDAQSVFNFPKNVTIAGQSAPGPVIIMGGVTKCGSSNVIARNLTFATGYGMRGFNEPDKVPPTVPTPGDFPDASIYDALEINGPNMIFDHLAMLDGSAGIIWCREAATSLTIQYSIMAESQNYPQGIPGSNPLQYSGRAYGATLQGGPGAKQSIIHNLLAHSKSAIVAWNGSGPFNDIRNNVVYNFTLRGGFTTSTGSTANNFINNFYLAGPGGDEVSGTNIISAPGQTLIFSGSSSARAYISGNLKDINKNGSPFDTLSADADHFFSIIQPSANDVNIGLTLPTMTSFTNVLYHAGPRWWIRPYDFALGNTNAITTNDVASYVDQRLILETVTGTGKVKAWADDPFTNSPSEGWEWRAMLALRADSNTFAAPFNRPANWDTDGDGMPDYWELEHGLNASVTNNNGDFDNDGYTDLEEYLNEIAAWPAPGNIVFNGNTNNRYALIHNWQVNGVAVNITNLGTVTTSSKWQPSKYDTAIISNNTVVVDSVGQHAGTIRLAPDAANNATLNITNGWLKVANTLEIATAGTAALNLSGGRLYVSNLVMVAGSGSFNFTGGTLSADVVGFDLLNQGGTIAPGNSPGSTHVLGDLTLQSASTLDMELGGTGPGQSDKIIVDGDLTLAGTVNITNLAGFGAGTYVLITYEGTLSGSLVLGAQPAGYAYKLDISVPGEVRLIIAGPPVFESVLLSAGGQFVASGSGYSNGPYLLLASTNLELPLNLWTPIATNLFDGSGHFSVTNLINLNQPRMFYRLQLQ